MEVKQFNINVEVTSACPENCKDRVMQNPLQRYIIASFDQKLAVALNYILPGFLFRMFLKVITKCNVDMVVLCCLANGSDYSEILY